MSTPSLSKQIARCHAVIAEFQQCVQNVRIVSALSKLPLIKAEIETLESVAYSTLSGLTQTRHPAKHHPRRRTRHGTK